MASFLARSHPAQCSRFLPLRAFLPRLEEMMQERGIKVDHSTLNRWVLSYAPELDKRIRPNPRLTNDSWRVDETYVKVKGAWKYLYRAVDSEGNTRLLYVECKT